MKADNTIKTDNAAYEDRVILRHVLNLTGRFVICIFSSLRNRDEIRHFLELMRRLKRSRPEAALLIAGDGPLLTMVAAGCEYDELTDMVFPIGSTNNPAAIISASDAMLVLGVRKHIRLAGSCNTPVLAFDKELSSEDNLRLLEEKILTLPVPGE